jgi:hypothetical protein
LIDPSSSVEWPFLDQQRPSSIHRLAGACGLALIDVPLSVTWSYEGGTSCRRMNKLAKGMDATPAAPPSLAGFARDGVQPPDKVNESRSKKST